MSRGTRGKRTINQPSQPMRIFKPVHSQVGEQWNRDLCELAEAPLSELLNTWRHIPYEDRKTATAVLESWGIAAAILSPNTGPAFAARVLFRIAGRLTFEGAAK